MGFLGTFQCDRCGYTVDSNVKDNYYGCSVIRYDADTWLCEKCRDGLQNVIRDYIHATGPFILRHPNEED